jgi:SNF2 family DNA or RNA helicase
MLKNNERKAYKAFMKIETPRRICLTGTPFQNNLLEYYHMISFVRPGLLGNSEKKFQKEYMDPIQSSMASDAAEDKKTVADDRLTRFVDTLEPFIHRRDASLLRNDLPSLQQVCLHVIPTKIQRALYGAFREHQEVTNEKNFLKQYTALRPVSNHPGTLFLRNLKRKDSGNKKKQIIENPPVEQMASKLPSIKSEPVEDKVPQTCRGNQEPQDADFVIEIYSSEEEEDDGDESFETNNTWWTKVSKKFGAEKMKRIERYGTIYWHIARLFVPWRSIVRTLV